MIAFRRFVFEYAASNMYAAAENGTALVTDPFVSGAALEYLRENNVSHVTVLLTHEHYDHISGVKWLSDAFDTVIICQEKTAEALACGRNNRPLMVSAARKEALPPKEIKAFLKSLPGGFVGKADIAFKSEYSFYWQGHLIHMVHCPGHSPGSCCIETDTDAVFTGDSLIPGTPVITRFPGGSEKDYRQITVPYLESIGNDVLILPGHGESCVKRNICYTYDPDYNGRN